MLRRSLLPLIGVAAIAALIALGRAPGAATRAPAQTLKPAARPRLAVHAAPAAAAAAPAPVAATGQVVLSAPWGGGARELGRRAANESSPEGPMSFAVDDRGRAFVLDQVNARVSVFEGGNAVRTLPLPADTFQDIALRDDGGLAVLDRFGAESVAYLNPEGSLTHEVALAGEGVPSGGDVTALFQRGDGTWVEVQHASLVRIADADGNALAERDVVAGRFAPDGSLLRMSKSGASAASLAIIEPGARPRALARVEFPLPVWQLLALETDASGRIVVAADLYQEGPAPAFELLDARETLVVLSREGAELSRFELPASSGAEESLRRVRVGADGSVYHMAFAEAGVSVRRFAL